MIFPKYLPESLKPRWLPLPQQVPGHHSQIAPCYLDVKVQSFVLCGLCIDVLIHQCFLLRFSTFSLRDSDKAERPLPKSLEVKLY